ncbi:pitrilysin family protein [Cardinium endosymbiont of Tipula unca]|uniref:M16 family metallopeptidase n=1 Tax=Cardinium endosymbiont of Tipula unca TaxID=3066216 RepID=UPI0030CE2518
MFDRTIPPAFKEIEDISFAWPEHHLLQNQMPLYVLNSGSQPIIELELVFKSGSYYEVHPGAAYFTSSMLLEGTKDKSTQDIAHLMDYYGATIGTRSQADFCVVYLSTLSKYLSPMLDLLVEILLASNFPKKSLKLLKNLTAQTIQVADKKNHRVAYKRFVESLFTKTHPYGRHLTLQDVGDIQLEHLHDYYANALFLDCTAFVSGQVTPVALQLIQQSLEQLPQKKGYQVDAMHGGNLANKVHLTNGKCVQSAIVIGKQLMVKKEPDFLPMVVVNELFGGYFGSRLMRNIREEKGYSYGIHSTMVALQKAGYLVITTEVSQDVTQEAIQEIYKEIDILQHELVAEEELQKVKNYLLGSFLRSTNDPFSIMQKFQSAYLHGLDKSYYDAFYHQVRNITPLEISSLAQKYLSLDTFTEVVVG